MGHCSPTFAASSQYSGTLNKKQVLKNSTLLVIAIAFGIALISSCRAHDNCPAYGKADTVEVNADRA
jgi:hypothetical protein